MGEADMRQRLVRWSDEAAVASGAMLGVWFAAPTPTALLVFAAIVWGAGFCLRLYANCKEPS